MSTYDDLRAALQWQIEMGVDECVGDKPANRLVPPPPAAAEDTAPAFTPNQDPPRSATTSRGPKTDPQHVDGDLQIKTARQLAADATTIDALRDALASFDGCGLKKTATNLVLADGAIDANLMFVGEAPGAEEDRQGVPFVGPSGQLLNAMLDSIGIARSDVLISNTVFWRPPGNRTPTTQEAALCRPFIARLVELVAPKVLVCVGAPAAHTMLGETQGISRLRGKWYDYELTPGGATVAATALFHPAYLLRTPIKKREAWRDLLMIRDKLNE